MVEPIIRFAKILVEGTGHSCGMTRQDFEAEIAKRAESVRGTSDSAQQAFTKYATQTEVGQLLFKAAMRAPVGKQPQQAPQDLPYEPIGDASAELERTARQMARSKNITYERAYTALLTDPALAEQRDRVKAEERAQTSRVRAARWPLNEADQQSKTRSWLGSR